MDNIIVKKTIEIIDDYPNNAVLIFEAECLEGNSLYGNKYNG